MVDDSADLRGYLTGLLSPVYDVLLASNGRDAIDQVTRCAPDIILSDVMMPGLDGFGLVRELRGDPSTASIPVFLLSLARRRADDPGLEAGADDYLAKPFTTRELLARVRTHLELSRVRRAMVAELERMNGELITANHELDAFARSVSHDLRAPLRAINGFAGLIAQSANGQLSPRSADLLEKIRAAANRMELLIQDLLRFARLSRQPLSKSDVDAAELVTSVVRELLPDGGARDIRIDIRELPAVAADRALLAQVFTNLISNALKFTRPSIPAVIEVGFCRDDGIGVFFVRDNGVGFDARYADKLFGVFQRLHSAEEYEGTGVGLSLVKSIVTRHGGRIWAEAEPDKGATFYFSLPMR